MYRTVSLIMPSIFKLIRLITQGSSRSPSEIGYDRNAPRKVPHKALQGKIQEARSDYNSQLRHRCDLHLNDEVKKFLLDSYPDARPAL